ncbi:uncharacterized protein LOC121978575 [Zingiber officinale]|uniref:uncharacterized protein LOC121978575 n=1 Tax=Zingiber officinale TaxID=94328 RepID=UPI001C4C898D|nr:uncharacterized protein LOC121978575 [Zingiber officinale]
MSRVVILCRPTWLRIHCCKIQITCLRVAKYGGGGNKVGATKPHGEMPFHPFQSTPNDKRPASAPRRASFANGKENRRAVSAGKSFIARPKLEGNSAAIAGVRLSTSSFPRGSAGNATESGFCSWDYYTRDIQAFCMEDTTNSSPLPCSSMMPLGSLSNAGLRRSNSCATSTVEQQQWCGRLAILR